LRIGRSPHWFDWFSQPFAHSSVYTLRQQHFQILPIHWWERSLQHQLGGWSCSRIYRLEGRKSPMARTTCGRFRPTSSGGTSLKKKLFWIQQLQYLLIAIFTG
jgi:hypothetical protein